VDLDNIDLAFQISFLCYLQAEIYLFKVKFLESARLNFYFRSDRTVFPMCYLDRIFKDVFNDVLHVIVFAV